MSLVAAHVPEPDVEADRTALAHAFAELTSLGVTSVHDAGVDARTLALYRELAAADALPVRIYALLSGHALALELGAPAVDPNARLSVRAVKLYADGALGSRGAALLAPYADAPTERGLRFLDDATLAGQVAPLIERGFQVAIHAIGDAANRQVLDVYAKLGIDPAARHRIEHAQVLAPGDVARFAGLGVIASMQPIHATSDRVMAIARLGNARLGGAYAWQALRGAGATIVAGSDFPVEPANPFFGLHAAITRQGPDGEPPGGWLPAQRMSRAEALCAFTRDAAYAAHQENALGTLEPGHWADFVLLDEDYFFVPPGAIRALSVRETWSAGAPVYRRSGS